MAEQMLKDGAPMQEVMAWLGHSNISTTDLLPVFGPRIVINAARLLMIGTGSY
jgi:hypothetical protein